MIIPQVFAIVLFFLIPILLYLLSIVIIRFGVETSESRIRRLFFSARKPLEFNSLSNEDLQQVPDTERSRYVTHEVVARLVTIYLVIGIFLLSNIIGTFYHVMADVLQHVGNYGEEEIRMWSAIVFTTPFSGGWIGTFPWYGYGFWPSPFPETYHEPWNWLFHTTSLVTGNPTFFQDMAQDFVFIPMIFGLILLLPLARKSVWESFLPSILHLNVSMLIMVNSLFNGFAEAFKLVVLSQSITFGGFTVNASSLYGLPFSFMISVLSILIIMFILFFGFSYRLARNHYSSSRKGKWLFVANTTILFWLSLILTIIV
jgi:hypothetical protein